MADLERSEKFYQALGFVKNPKFSDDNAIDPDGNQIEPVWMSDGFTS